MSKKTKTILMLLAIAAVAAIVAVLLLRKGEPSPQEREDAVYDRMQNEEYRKILDFEKAEQKKTMRELARARQNLEEAREAKLEPEVIKELEAVVLEEEKNLELERDRMRANLRRELWKEQHPEQVGIIDGHRAREAELMAQVDEAKKRLEDAKAAGASADEVAALKGDLDALVARLAENHNEAEAALRKLNNK